MCTRHRNMLSRNQEYEYDGYTTFFGGGVGINPKQQLPASFPLSLDNPYIVIPRIGYSAPGC